MPPEKVAVRDLKHGPIALVDENMPVIVIAPHDNVFEKTFSNMPEVAARGGRLIVITDGEGARAFAIHAMVTLTVYPRFTPQRACRALQYRYNVYIVTMYI